MRADLKIAITGATGADGQALRGALATHKIPADHVVLLDKPSDEAIISEYEGAPALIAALDREALSDRDLVFLCGSAEESARCLAWERSETTVIVDMSGAAAAGARSPVVNLHVNATELASRPRVIAAPHAISLAATSALAPLGRAAGIERVAGVFLRPVSDFGEKGIEELHRQTVSLLSFAELPREVFGRQMAFNLLPQSALEANAGSAALHARLGGEIDRILGWPEPRATIRLMVAPVFHGHVALLHVVLRGPLSLAGIRKALAGSPGLSVPKGARGPLSPVEIVDKGRDLLVDVSPDGIEERGLWISLVGSQLREIAADNAVEIAGQVLSG